MSIERLGAILDAYGADPLRWPSDERLALQGFAARDPRAAAMLAEADGLDGLLALAPSQAPSPALFERILASRPRPNLESRLRGAWMRLFPDMPAWRPAAGFALALALGFGVQLAAVDHLGFGEAQEVATSTEATSDQGQTLAPLTGDEPITEEDVL